MRLTHQRLRMNHEAPLIYFNLLWCRARCKGAHCGCDVIAGSQTSLHRKRVIEINCVIHPAHDADWCGIKKEIIMTGRNWSHQTQFNALAHANQLDFLGRQCCRKNCPKARRDVESTGRISGIIFLTSIRFNWNFFLAVSSSPRHSRIVVMFPSNRMSFLLSIYPLTGEINFSLFATQKSACEVEMSCTFDR